MQNIVESGIEGQEGTHKDGTYKCAEGEGITSETFLSSHRVDEMLCVQEEGRTEAILDLSKWEYRAYIEMHEGSVYLSGDRDQLQVQLLNLNPQL